MSEREIPYDVVFRRGDIDFDARFDAVREEAAARDMAVDDPERFIMLGAVGALLRDILLAEEAADAAGDVWHALPPAAIAQAGALVYQAYRFREAGAPVYPIDEATARALIAGEDAEPADAPREATVGDARAGYVQLPRNLFWARPDDGAAAEPIDGFFFAFGRRIELLLALGVRPRRPGFTAIPIGVDLDRRDALGRWTTARAREAGDDFANILPGGDIDRLHGLTSTAEALKLAALALRHFGIASAPDAASDRASERG